MTVSNYPPRRVGIIVRAVGIGLILLPISAEAETPGRTVRELQRQLQERDAIIRDLARRIEEVERRMGERPDTSPPKQPTAGPAAATAPVSTMQPPSAATAAAGANEQPDAAQTAQSTPTSESKPSTPGQVTATEEEAERALERTLTATGALLLEYGQIEIEPSFTYAHRDNEVSVLTPAGFVDFRVRRNEFEEALGVRAGLPLDAQAELRLPYSIVHQQVSFGEEGISRTGSGMGDVSVGLAKTVLREKGWRPDVTARVTWNTPTGQSEDDNVALVSGSGFNQIIGELVALKRQDPLAFVLSGSYQRTFNKKDGVEPGDEYGFVLGAYLATSPETSVNLSLQQTFSNDYQRHGRTVNESGQVQSVLNIGISSILERQMLLNLTAGVGLTDDSPDYTVMLSLPIRFGIPVP
jgi:hypothetical protein